MLICLVTLISSLLLFKDTGASLLELVRQCVPTATMRGPCHICVCTSEGVYNCRPQKCQSENLEISRPNEDCEPLYVYRESNVFCRCSSNGYWKSSHCSEKFRYLQSKISLSHLKLRTNVECVPNSLYLIECNICRCSSNGYIDLKLCTNRYCVVGHKADSCSYGGYLRLQQELCSCSDIGYYIDRLCISISEKVIQAVRTSDMTTLVDIGRSWRRLKDLQSKACHSDEMYTVDCNQCVCVDGIFNCTKNICEENKKVVLRHEEVVEVKGFESLPSLKSDGERCNPGTKYRYKCNTCLCSDGYPSCTTMICLEDFVLDIKSLRGALSG